MLLFFQVSVDAVDSGVTAGACRRRLLRHLFFTISLHLLLYLPTFTLGCPRWDAVYSQRFTACGCIYYGGYPCGILFPR